MPALPDYAVIEQGGPASVAARAFGRKMIAVIAASKLRSDKLVRTMPDGTTLIALRAGKQYKLVIQSPRLLASVLTSVEAAALWIPRGFVVYPATDAAPLGWGLPIQADATVSAFDAKNRAPGLDVARWTVGGVLGQALLTRVPSAGYPAVTTRLAPMYFSTTKGTRPKRNPLVPRQDTHLDSFDAKPWAAFRLELADYQTTAPDSLGTYKRALFTLVNQHRKDIGRDPLNLPLRGTYPAAQAFADESAGARYLAHYTEHFDATYRTPNDRVYKDGPTYPLDAASADDRNKGSALAENVCAEVAGTFTTVGTDPDGAPIQRQDGAGVTFGPAKAFELWMASAPHRANIESTEFDGFSSFMDNGVRANYATQDYTRRDQWIECGNACWISNEPEIPPLSWHSFHTRNLAWETWPVVYDNVHSTLSASTPLVDPADGSFWLKYVYSPRGNTFEFGAPVLSSFIFMRGRVLAIAPHGGLVWAAAIQKISSNLSTVPTLYRLIALVHHEGEQPADKIRNGMTSVLHVWYVDLPDVLGFAANPQSIVRGVRGAPVGAGTWPWIDPEDPWSWSDGGTVDVGSDASVSSDPCMLKYSSMWRFNRDATRAVCMRDFGTAAQWESSLATTGLLVLDGAEAFPILLEFSKQAPEEYLGTTPPAPGITRTVIPFVDSAGVSTSFATPPIGHWDTPGATWSMAAYAADFDDTDDIRYFYIGTFRANGMSPTPTLLVAGVGDKRAMVPGDLQMPVVIGGHVQSTDAPQDPFEFHVLDVNDAALVVESAVSQLTWAYSAGSLAVNPDYTPCWGDTTAAVHHVAAYRAGELLHGHWYGNPGGVFLLLRDLCIVHTFGSNAVATILPVSLARAVQASYAVSRDGQWVLSYQVAPQPGVLRIWTSDAAVTTCDASFGGACKPTIFDYANVDGTGTPTTATRVLINADVAPRGGWCTASFADQAALAALTQSPGDNLRFITARSV